jgi:uncharacterized membrane protein
MNNSTKTRMLFGIIFVSLMVCLSYLVVDEVTAQLSFTYTTPSTQKTVCIGDTTQFNSTLTNTGSVADTYDIDRIEKPPTPADWWMRFCSGGICWDSLVTHAEVSLNPAESDQIDLDILPRLAGTGNVTMRITSQSNPSLKDSITFILHASEECPVTDRWGLLVLVSLIFVSGLYLIFKRLRPAKTT